MKNYWKEINWLDRERMVELLEANGAAVYDDNSTQELRECIAEAVECGGIAPDQLENGGYTVPMRLR